MLIVAVLLFTVLLRFAIILAVAYLLLPKHARCPHCDAEMMPIRNRFLRRVVPWIERRWCMECGWNGVVRRSRTPTRRDPAPRPAPRPTPE